MCKCIYSIINYEGRGISYINTTYFSRIRHKSHELYVGYSDPCDKSQPNLLKYLSQCIKENIFLSVRLQMLKID